MGSSRKETIDEFFEDFLPFHSKACRCDWSRRVCSNIPMNLNHREIVRFRPYRECLHILTRFFERLNWDWAYKTAPSLPLQLFLVFEQLSLNYMTFYEDVALKRKQRFLDQVWGGFMWEEDGKNCRDMIINWAYFFTHGNENCMIALINEAAKSDEDSKPDDMDKILRAAWARRGKEYPGGSGNTEARINRFRLENTIDGTCLPDEG